MKKYIPKDIEPAITQKWEAEGTYKATETPGKDKAYTLVMFPYPSGAGLHTGHARVYTGTDVIARYHRMRGESVLHPMGWDAFGLPAENAAIKLKKNPMDIVPHNIANFKQQMQRLGLSYDWSKEFSTTDPSYYQWTQWLFIQFFKMGLLHKKETPIFYCPSCKTGLALEEVLADGTHERCGNKVEERVLPQWIFRITKYADDLLADLDGLDWPAGILQMQRNWIGKKEGMVIHHKVEGMEYVLDTFTAYPAWSFADTYLVVAPEHPLVDLLLESGKGTSEVSKYVSEIRSIPADERAASKEKTGVFTGLYAIDPFRPNEKMPIWIANFALMTFGTGAIRCSAHDPRDVAFAQKYNIPLREVVKSETDSSVNAHEGSGTLRDSGPFTGKEVTAITAEFIEWANKENIGEKKTIYHLRDWVFSRQRYWGEPIPMVFCQSCADDKVSYWSTVENDQNLYPNTPKIAQKISEFVGEIEDSLYGWFPLSEENLPLKLPYVDSYEPTETGQSPLSQIPEFVKTTCPHCEKPATRETDTMPNWAGSCWYFLYFSRGADFPTDTKPSLQAWNDLVKPSAMAWNPVDWYIGGAEHAVLHLLYSRFWMKALNDIGLVNFKEPFTRLRSVGIVLASDNRKMSKSLGNVINPNDVIDEFGADTLRVYEMFMAPFGQEVAWSTAAMQGAYRFVSRIWQIYYSSDKFTKEAGYVSKTLDAELQSVISTIDSDITNVKFNTCISALMKFLNLWEESKDDMLSIQGAQDFLKLLAPFAPYMSDHIWRDVFGHTESIHIAPWPQKDESLTLEKQVTIAIQVQGKVRGTVSMSASQANQEVVLSEALKLEGVQRYIDGKEYKVIYVPGRVLNFVL